MKPFLRDRLLLAALLILPGCNILGAAAAKMPKPDIDAAYKGLVNEKVGVMVWADRSLLMDWPSLRQDVGQGLERKLKAAQQAETEELKGMTFPYEAKSYVLYQLEHPEIEAKPITAVAPKFGITRLIYVEVSSLTTRPEEAIGLFIGNVEASIKVIEIKDGKADYGYEEGGIRLQFPETSPREGTPRGNDRVMYVGVVDALTTELSLRFFKHPDYSN